MLRRVHVPQLRTGEVELDSAGSRHARDVLRLTQGTEVEVFDDAGAVARGTIVRLDPLVVIQIAALAPREVSGPELTIASAVPKGDRADWMVEKLSELGTARFVPLATARSVVLPEGKNKRQRWERLATESAKQSRRRGVMRIDELTPLNEAVKAAKADGSARFLTTGRDAETATTMLRTLSPAETNVTLFIGPEGGWTDEELALFRSAGLRGLKLTETVLRVETAAITAAAIVLVSAAAASNRTTPI